MRHHSLNTKLDTNADSDANADVECKQSLNRSVLEMAQLKLQLTHSTVWCGNLPLQVTDSFLEYTKVKVVQALHTLRYFSHGIVCKKSYYLNDVYITNLDA